MRAVLLGLVSLAGCNSILGIHDLATTDGGGGVDVAPSAVNGTAIDTYYASPTVTSMVPEDLSATVIQAYVPDASAGGFRIIDGVGRKDGTFTIPDVPAGSYYLLVQSSGDAFAHFLETSSHTPDLGLKAVGRQDGATATKSTVMTFHLSGLAPWDRTVDSLAITSYATGLSQSVPPLTDGATALDPYTLDWQTVHKPLLDTTHGDDLFVVHRRRNGVVTTIADAFAATDVTLVDGQPASVTGAFTPPAVTGTTKIYVDASSFIDGFDVPFHGLVYVSTNIYAGFVPGYLGGAVVSTADQYKPTAGVNAIDVTYRDPYPASWVRNASVGLSLEWSFATRITKRPVSYVANGSASPPLGNPMEAIASVGAPHAITVGGVAARSAAAVPFDGTHPVPVEWAAVPGISHYMTAVFHIGDNGSAGTVTVVALVETTAPRSTLPASLFSVGETYIISVLSVADAHAFADGILRRDQFGSAFRESVGPRLLFAASCGNGNVDAAYEQCDSSGADTADCNADCTKPVCGDGIKNAAAGEICDDAADSLACDSDCTVPQCGDGHVNGVVGEGCDDGNTNPGDGCSSGCAVDAGYSCTGSPSVCTKP